MAIPVFHNLTETVGIEAYFTNALRSEFSRSKVADVQSKNKSSVTIEGQITSIRSTPTAQAQSGKSKDARFLPNDTSLTTEYRMYLTALITLRRNSDKRVIWEGQFTNEKVYSAPQLSVAGVNSANANYHHSKRHSVIADLAEDMMKEAHDRITERF